MVIIPINCNITIEGIFKYPLINQFIHLIYLITNHTIIIRIIISIIAN